MGWLVLSRRAKIGLLIFALIAATAFFPLRIALDLAGTGASGASARQVRGVIWSGRIEDLSLGTVNLGSVRAAVSPVQLLVGRVRLDLWRDGAQGDGPLRGAWTVGFNQRGIDDVTGTVPVGGAFAPLPLSTLEFDDVTVHFAGDTCAKAEGRVRAQFAGEFAGLRLSRGLSGAVACDGNTVLFPLVSQTGMDKLSLRLSRDGRFTAQIAVKTGGDGNSEGGMLAAAGLKRQGGDYVMTIEGQM